MKEQTKKTFKSHSAVDVRQFIQDNYTPYTGDDSFLAGPTERTSKLWDLCMDLKKAEIANGGVLDLETSVPTSITAHEAGYINPEDANNTSKYCVSPAIYIATSLLSNNSFCVL